MFVEDLSNTPVQVCNPGGLVEAVRATNASGNAIFLKLYDSASAPSGTDDPEFSWEVADGESITLISAKIFGRGCYIAASTTTGASLTDIGVGLDVNIAGVDVLPTP